MLLKGFKFKLLNLQKPCIWWVRIFVYEEHVKYPSKVSVCQQNLVFNSLTNCLGPRKLLHSGKVSKTAKCLWEPESVNHAGVSSHSRMKIIIFFISLNEYLKMINVKQTRQSGEYRVDEMWNICGSDLGMTWLQVTESKTYTVEISEPVHLSRNPAEGWYATENNIVI